MKKIVSKLDSFLYSKAQIGIVFLLLVLILLHLPSAIYGSIFFVPITQNEVDYYAKFGAWFTAIGAIFTIINTIVVIYLMIFLHKKENEFNMLNNFSELRKRLLYINTLLKKELEFFDEKQYAVSENLYLAQYDYHESQYENLYKRESKYLHEIFKLLQDVYKNLTELKDSYRVQNNISLADYRDKIELLDKIDDLLTLKKPSSEYQRGFIEGNREETHEDDILEASNTNALEAINALKKLLTS